MYNYGPRIYIERSVTSFRLALLVAPCSLTFVRRVNSRTFKVGIRALRFLASGWAIGILIDRYGVMSARDAGA